jgi:hypothetical protein
MLLIICGSFCVGVLVYISVMSNDAKVVEAVIRISCRSVIRWTEFSTLKVLGSSMSLFMTSETSLASLYAGAFLHFTVGRIGCWFCES